MAVFTAIAGAVAGAIGLAGAAASTFIGTAVFALKFVATLGLSLALSALAGKKSNQATFGVQGKLQAGGDVPRSIILGTTATAGSLVYAGAWGQDGKTPNAYFTQVIALADLPVQDLVGLWVNGERVTILWDDAPIAQGHPVEQYRKDGKDHLWVRFQDGWQTAADEFLVATFGGAAKPWSADRIGRGVAYIVLTAKVAEDLWTGFPSFRMEVEGCALYDPSRDSSVGGVGPQRYDQPETWGGDGDHLPAVQIYNLLRGLRWEGAWLYGLQDLPPARLPVADWIAAIGQCRAEVAGLSGPEPTYRAGVQIAVNASLADALGPLVTACHGRLAESGGVYKLRCGAPGPAVMAIDDGVILSSQEQSFTPFLGLARTINGISGRYPNPAEGYATKVAPPLYRSDFEAVDGGRRLLADIAFEAVPYAAQVQRLMHAALEEARRARRHTFVLPPDYAVLEAGDVISWGSERNFYEDKLFRVDGVVDRANLDVLVDLTEVDPADYDPPAAGYRPEIDGPLTPSRPAPQAMVDWYAAPYMLIGADGSQRPGILLGWDGDQPDVDLVAYQVRVAESGVVILDGVTQNVAAGALIITQSLIRATAYQARGRYVALSGRETLWSAWLDVTTPDARITEKDISDQLSKLLDQIRKRDAETIRAILDDHEERIERLAAAEVTTAGQSYEQIAVTKVGVDNNFAAIGREEKARVAADNAQTEVSTVIASRVTSAETGITGLAGAQSTLSTQVTLQGGYITSISSDVVALSSSLTTANGQIAANATAVNSLSTTVSNQGGILSSLSSSITALYAQVNNASNGLPATASAVSSLSAQVNDPATGLGAIAASYTDLTAKWAGATASGSVSMVVAATPAGYSAAYEVRLAAAGSSAAYRMVVGAGVSGIDLFAARTRMIGNDGTPFAIFDGGTRQLILERAPVIGSDKLQLYSATKLSSMAGFNSVTGYKGMARTLVQTFNFSLETAGMVLIDHLSAPSGGYLDAATVWTMELDGGGVVARSPGYGYVGVAIKYLASLSAGSHQVRIYVEGDPLGGNNGMIYDRHTTSAFASIR